jgi:hypothetical protein
LRRKDEKKNRKKKKQREQRNLAGMHGARSTTINRGTKEKSTTTRSLEGQEL